MTDNMAGLSSGALARMIDISAVQAFHGKKEIDELVDYAVKYNFISVHTLPSWTAYLSERLAAYPDILVGAPVGFPSGGSRTEIKLREAEYLLEDGVQEMDMVINIGKLRSEDFSYVRSEIKMVRKLTRGVPLKIILEIHHLTDTQIKKACEICIEEEADFVKTGTGWAPTGATVEAVRKIKDIVGDAIKIKASGGIRDLESLMEMYEIGVERFGINVQTSIEIIKKAGGAL